MDHKIIFFALSVIVMGQINVLADPLPVVDEKHDWKSFDDVVMAYTALPESSDVRFYTHKTQQALGLGLRSAERILDTMKMLGASGEKRASLLEKTLISNKSMREIALLGLMMSLSETRNVPLARAKEWAQQRYKIKEVGEDVLESRLQTLEALDTLFETNPQVAP